MKNFCQKRFHLIFSVSYVDSTEVNGSAVVLPVDDLAENKWKTKNFPTSTITFGTMQVFQDHKILVMAHSPLLAGKST